VGASCWKEEIKNARGLGTTTQNPPVGVFLRGGTGEPKSHSTTGGEDRAITIWFILSHLKRKKVLTTGKTGPSMEKGGSTTTSQVNSTSGTTGGNALNISF